ncbi:MAG: membrane protein insertase YidC [Bdellovibrionaceae bacterium]|nr:membrane protein insertase YidC [Pseudobdellovibrionaceae bacterium]
MKSPEEKSSFLDRGTIIAVVLTIVFFTGWNMWVEKKYPKPAPSTPVVSQPTEQVPTSAPATVGTPTPASGGVAVASSSENISKFESENLAFEISSKGMGLRQIVVRSHTTRDNKPILLGSVTTNYPFATSLSGTSQALDFAVEKTDETTFVGRASAAGANIVKTMKFDPTRYTFEVRIDVTGGTEEFKGLSTFLSDTVSDAEHSIFAPSFDVQDFTVVHEGSRSQFILNKEKGLEAISEKNVSLLAFGTHYFTMALLDRSDVAPTFTAAVAPKAQVAVGMLTHTRLNANAEFSVEYKAFTGPKALHLLNAVDPELGQVVNYGMFAWIAKPLLWLLKFLNNFFHNFGLSIIILTIIVRLVVLPFNVYSFKSMKAMQKIQPEMQRLRERYKSDPQTMNREVMELMRRSKANPLGGCLPMLLQLPVFLALYQVLGQSIELYQAPFMFWIHDLSAKDPFYVLPAFMAVAMYVQQKITPTTMPPEQAKIMQWLPLIFAFMMISLPSGLTLYIAVSTIFGVIQQYLFMREKTPNAKVSQVRA